MGPRHEVFVARIDRVDGSAGDLGQNRRVHLRQVDAATVAVAGTDVARLHAADLVLRDLERLRQARAPTSKISSSKRPRSGGPAPSLTSLYSAGRLPRWSTAATPSNFSALLVSRLLTLACGCGLRSVRVYSARGMVMCWVY